MRKLGDNCDACNQDYQFSRKTDELNVYPDEAYSHIRAVCPNCGAIERIYVDKDAIGLVILSEQIPIKKHKNVPKDVREMRDQLELEAPPHLYHDDRPGELPWPSRDDLIELWDTMRHFGGECGKRCLWHDWE